MVEPQSSWDDDVERQVRKYAKRVFRGRKNRDELVEDVVSLVWEWWTAAQSRMLLRQYANYACKWVRTGKHLQRSERSIDVSQSSRGQVKPFRVTLNDVITTGPGTNPAILARLHLDFAAWLLTLTPQQAAILDCFLHGELGKDVAKKFGLTPGRVSQHRRELVGKWKSFTS